MYKISMFFIVMMLLSGCATTTGEPEGSQRYWDGKWLSEDRGAKIFPQHREAMGKKTFVFSPRDMAWAAYDENGNRVRAGSASGGVDSCPEGGGDCRTVTGTFSVMRKGNASCVSRTYPGQDGGAAPMKYCMFFHQGYAIHGAAGIPTVHSSHGCIRVTVESAQWLNHEFLEVGSPVIVESY